MLTARQFMTVGSLFSGIGGFDLGLERAGMRVEWQVENNDYAREVLKKHWPTVPCHYDVTKIDWRDIPRVDLICGGFPCQPFSIAGKRRGAADDRYLWPEVVRCLDALRPTWFLGENVPGIINLALDQVCTDLESLGYQVWPVVIPACAVDAPHQRKRVWIVAHAESQRKDPVSQSARQRILQPNGKSGDVAHAECTGPQGRGCERQLGETCQEVEVGRCGDVADASRKLPYGSGARSTRRSQYSDGCRWLPEPSVGRVAHGIPQELDGGGLDEEELNEEGSTASRTQCGDVRDVRLDGANAAASSELCGAGSHRDPMSTMPCQSRSSRRHASDKADEGVQGVREELSSMSHEEAQHMQQGMSGRNRETKRNEAMGWLPEPRDIPRVATGVKHRVDRLRGLGNAVVPQVVEALGRMILEVDPC